jgi:hypothetical protein
MIAAKTELLLKRAKEIDERICIEVKYSSVFQREFLKNYYYYYFFLSVSSVWL